MRDTQRSDTSMIRRTVLTLATLAVAISMTACSHAMMMIRGTGANRPAASEFGLGPRASAEGRYVAMPQHGHGLPTRPRVTRNLGDGIYEIEGVRFNMGGWWEFKLAIAGSRGADTVTFNLEL